VLDLASVSPFHEHNGNGHTNGSLNGNGIAHANPGVMNETLIAGDPIMRQVLDLTDAIATRRSSVLIVGEPGTGKKTLARLLHSKSARRDGPFVVFSCQGRRESELEVELLGRTGSGTEAETQGLLGRAAGGTLFLDDVQCLSPSLQLHVLRAVRGAEVGQNGGDKPRSECRLVLGCSEELGPLVERGQFRSDLFYALSAVTIQLPPLRHRSEDITSLAEHFRDEYSTKYGKSIVGISPDAARRLASHDWPQNVAELRTTIEQAVQRCRGHWIEANHLGLDSPTGSAAREGLGGLSAALRQSILPLKEALEEPEKRLILEALRALNWNRQETARVLDINRTTLYKKMKKYGLIFEEPVWAN
jgi:two-component system response regulator HydG